MDPDADEVDEPSERPERHDVLRTGSIDDGSAQVELCPRTDTSDVDVERGRHSGGNGNRTRSGAPGRGVRLRDDEQLANGDRTVGEQPNEGDAPAGMTAEGTLLLKTCSE